MAYDRLSLVSYRLLGKWADQVDGMYDGARRGHRRRREETRRAIVDAGLRLFSQHGYTRTSMREIAGAVGVTDAALYKHFASKKELFDAILRERATVRWMDFVQETRRRLTQVSALAHLTVQSLTFIEQNRDFFRLVLFEALAGDPGALAHHEGVMARWRDGVHALLVGHEPPPADADALALAEDLVAAIWGIALQRLLGADPQPFIDAAGEPTARCRALARRLVARFLPGSRQTAEGEQP
jgi:AcrR family transcriptional regulator